MNDSADTSAGGENVEQLDRSGRVLGVVDRSTMRRENLWHRSTYICVLRAEDPNAVDRRTPLVVHRRALWKDIHPGVWDLAFGGVCGVGETWVEAARRELAEEAGIVDVPLVSLGEGRYEGMTTRVVAGVFAAYCLSPVIPADGEVDEVAEIAMGDMADWIDDHWICPDTLAVVWPLLLPLAGPL